MKNIAIFASGSGTNAENIANYFEGSDVARISLIVCNKADAYVFERARKLGIPSKLVTRKEMANEEAVMALLGEYHIDFIVLADAMVISGDEGIVKPQREIYDLLRSRINLPAEELCFIDDAEKNVNGSRVAGWNAIRFVTNDQVEADFEKFILESH